MKQVLLTWCLLAFIPLSSAVPADLEKEFPTSSGKKLQVDLKTGGSISVTGWEKQVVSVKAFRKGPDSDEAEIEMAARPFGVLVSSHYPGSRHWDASVRLEINVPEQYDLLLETTGGEIAIEHVHGIMEGKTMGGGIELHRLKGNLEFETMGGSIHLTDSEVDGSVKTMGGEVVVDNVTGRVNAQSMGGRVIQKNTRGRKGEKSNEELRIHTMGGEIRVDDAASGADLNTMGGQIHVKTAKDHVKANTMGGPVVIDGVDGWIEAGTMGGSIKARMTGDPAIGDRHVSLSSMSGEITLTVPEGLAMDFDIELAYTKGHSGEFRIISDFPIQQSEDPDWEYHDGSPRKVIHGTGKTGNGANTVKIRTINGDVIIKKL